LERARCTARHWRIRRSGSGARRGTLLSRSPRCLHARRDRAPGFHRDRARRFRHRRARQRSAPARAPIDRVPGNAPDGHFRIRHLRAFTVGEDRAPRFVCAPCVRVVAKSE
jgi:hypothetical protein